MKQKVRVRFAPSPTGMMHVGSARTALFNYLFARHHDGEFILRLEDTDRERFIEAGVEQIQHSLQWLGLVPDEGYWLGDHKGAHGPYVQSERLGSYRQIAEQLVESGQAYYSRITSEDFDKKRQAAIAAGKPFVYRHAMEPASSQQSGDNLPIRLKVGPGSTVWRDEVRGEFKVNNDIIDDFIIVKADGFPTYNFANVVDDHQMKISHVIRGDEFIASTPKHAMLYDLLGWQRPEWIHLPVINGSDGKKLSKRSGDTDVLDYRQAGYLPEALINFLALLGWNDGSEQEIYSLDQLISKFAVDRIQKSPAVFDRDRLDWMNGIYIREVISEQAYMEKIIEQLEKANIDVASHNQDYIKRAAALERERIKTFSQSPDALEFFFKAPKVTSKMIELVCAKSDQPRTLNILSSTVATLSECKGKTTTAIETYLRQLAEELGVGAGQLFYPIRVAITGKTAAPGLFETIAVLGIEETISRLNNVIAKLK